MMSGRWQRMFLSLITGPGWLVTGTSGYQGRPLLHSFTLLLSSSSSTFCRILCHVSISREELETLSDSGINYIRIPVGYWTWQVSFWTWQAGEPDRWFNIGPGRLSLGSLSQNQSWTTQTPQELSSTSKGFLSGWMSWE